MNYSLETSNEASAGGWVCGWVGGGGGGAGESNWNTSQRATSTPAHLSTSSHVFISHVPFHLAGPSFSSPALSFFFFFFFQSLFPHSPPSSFQMPDTAHVHSFVYQWTFSFSFFLINGKQNPKINHLNVMQRFDALLVGSFCFLLHHI